MSEKEADDRAEYLRPCRLASAAEQANRNSILSERPWIGAAFEQSDFASGKSPTFNIRYANSGKSPAIMDRIQSGGGFFPKALFPGFPDPAQTYTNAGVHLSWYLEPISSILRLPTSPSPTQ